MSFDAASAEIFAALDRKFQETYTDPRRLSFKMDIEIPADEPVVSFAGIQVEAFYDDTNEPDVGFTPGWIISRVSYKGADITDLLGCIDGARQLILDECCDQ